MRVKNIETGETFRLVIAPLVWGLVIPETGEAFSTMPARSPADHGVEIVQVSKRERELLEQHGIMQEQATLVVEGSDGEPTPACLEVGPALVWKTFGCVNSFEAEDHRVLAANANDIATLRRFGFGALKGLDEIEERLEREAVKHLRDAA